MNFVVVSIFPEMIEQAVGYGVVGIALRSAKITLKGVSPRIYANDLHQSVDDRPFGGGDGMVMLAEPLRKALEVERQGVRGAAKVIHLSPRGRPLTQARVNELAQVQNLILLASRYGGVDQRLLSQEVDEEISIGDFVLSGGELAALVLIDAIARQIPGVLGNQASVEEESFFGGLLEHPQFTRPQNWCGRQVPEVLLSGHHKEISRWKRSLSILTTASRRPDLLAECLAMDVSEIEQAIEFFSLLTDAEREDLGVFGGPTLVDRLQGEIRRRRAK